MKTIAFVTLLFVSITSYAQVRVGIVGAGAVTNFSYQDRTGGDNSKSIIGVQAGLMFDAPLGNSWSFRPQVLYSLKGAKQQVGNSDASLRLNYVEVPIQFMYGIKSGAGRVMLGVGPYLGYAFSGTLNNNIGGRETKESITFGSAQDQFKQVDLGLRLSVGYEIPSGVSVSLFFSPGLANISNYTNGAVRNTGVGISLGYWLSRR